MYLHVLFDLGTSKAPMAYVCSSAAGGSQDAGRGLNDSLRSLGLPFDPTGDLPLGGDSDS
jgi:hypothetical protein